jgi:thermostable 8-oxoguanine DNA glycosylase
MTNPMTEAAARAIHTRVSSSMGETLSWDDEFPEVRAGFIADAQAAITAIEPMIRADERAKVEREIVEWLREQDGHGYDHMRADCIEAGEHLK